MFAVLSRQALDICQAGVLFSLRGPKEEPELRGQPQQLSKGIQEPQEKLGQEKDLGSKRWSSPSCRISQEMASQAPRAPDGKGQGPSGLPQTSQAHRSHKMLKKRLSPSIRVKLNPFIRK